MGLSALTSTAFTGDVFRVHSTNNFGIFLAVWATILHAQNKIGTGRATVLWVAALSLCGIAGYRTSLIYLTIFPLLHIAIQRGARRLMKYFILVAIAVVLYVALLVFAEHLPSPIQRTTSVLPGVEVSYRAETAAASTVNWRFELWRRAAEQLPDYLWVGKGLVFSRREIDSLKAFSFLRPDNYARQIWSRQYHNGPLACMLDLGLPGAVVAFGLILCLVLDCRRRLLRPWRDRHLFFAYRALYAYLLTRVVLFFASLGDVRSMMHFLFLSTVLKGLSATDEHFETPLPTGAATQRGPPHDKDTQNAL